MLMRSVKKTIQRFQGRQICERCSTALLCLCIYTCTCHQHLAAKVELFVLIMCARIAILYTINYMIQLQQASVIVLRNQPGSYRYFVVYDFWVNIMLHCSSHHRCVIHVLRVMIHVTCRIRVRPRPNGMGRQILFDTLEHQLHKTGSRLFRVKKT